jgi:glycosyltransferase involved in cell wall biosynthesis
MRLIFVNRFFHPDESATSLMLGDLVFALGDEFGERHVIAGRSHYTGGGERLPASDRIDGVAVHRVLSLGVGNRSLAGRMLNFLSFYFFGFVAALRLAHRGDVLVCLTDPPLGSVVMAAAARLKGARLVNWQQDIYPETATRLGYGGEGNLILRILRRLRDASWRRAQANVAIGERMAAYLSERGIEKSRIRVIQNWADERALTPVDAAAHALRREWDYSAGHCVVGYSGNLGRAHDISTMLGAIERCPDQAGSLLRFLFIGGGAKLEAIQRMLSDGGRARVSFRGYQPRERLRESLSVPDIHWLSLDPALEGLIVPSKFYGAAAVGRPVLFVGDPQGEIARLIDEGECGRSFAPGQSDKLAAYLRELATDADLRLALGRNARAFSEQSLGRSARRAEWSALLRELSRSAAAPGVAPR